MKKLNVLISPILMVLMCAALSQAQQITISINKIIPNQMICGSISGLSAQDYKKYKVIVYVHTDQWYIHPYAGQGDGKSWASIQPDGGWQIQTVQRDFKADKVAAILVSKENYAEPSKIESLERIQKSSIVVKELQGTNDYGSL